MKKLTLLSIFCGLAIGIFAQQPLKIEKVYNEDTLSLLFGDTVFYLAMNQMDGYANNPIYHRGAILVHWNGKQINKNKHVMVNGERQSVTFFSSNNSIIEFVKPTGFNCQGSFKVKLAGPVTLGCVFNGDTIKTNITVKALDFETGFSAEQLRHFLGTPSNQTRTSIAYGKIQAVDGIEYDCTQLIRGAEVVHYLYENKYPGVVVVVNPNNDARNSIVKQPAWESLRKELLNLF